MPDQEAVETMEESSQPRSLVPTPREEAQGKRRPPRPGAVSTSGGAGRPRRPGLVAFFRGYLTDADPRHIEGPTAPLLVFGVIALVGTWDDTAFGIILPELRSDFTFDAAFVAASIGIGLVVGDLLGPVVGYVSDRTKRVWLVRAGTVLQNVASIWLGLAGGVGSLLGSRVAATAGATLPAPAQASLFADYYPSRSRVRSLAFLTAAGVVGGILGPIVAGAIATGYGWRATLVALGALATLASLGTFFLREPVRGYWDRVEAGATEEQAEHEQPPLGFAEAWRTAASITTVRRLWYASLFAPASAFGTVFLALYLGEQGIGPSGRGWIFALSGVVALLALPYAGLLGDRLLEHNPGRIMIALGIVGILRAASFVIIAFTSNVWVVVIVLIPSTFLGVVTLPAFVALYTLIIPPNMRGIGTQTGKPFEIASRILIIFIVQLGAAFTGITSSPSQATLLALALPITAGALITASSSLGVARDIRAARAAAMADEEARRARSAGRAKMLVCRDIDVVYGGAQVLFGVDFDVEEGETVALLGTNGAGKSTLMRAIAGVQEAANGAVFLDGRDITHQPAHKNAAAGVIMLPGGHAVFPSLTVSENLDVAAWLYRDDPADVDARRSDVLDLFPVLRERSLSLAGNLSGGEQQMLALGQALLMRPRLLMIDELSLGLAPTIVDQLLQALRRMHAEGVTIVLVEQSVNVATSIAERAVFMEKGEVRFDGRTSDLLARPELVRAVFMGGAASGPIDRGGRVSRRGSATPEQLLSVRDVHVEFGGVKALQGVDLAVADGEIVGIIGPNGAGKTTLFDVISGFLPPATGTIALGDDDITGLAPDARARLGLGRSFQSARLFPALTVRENLAVALESRIKAKNPVLSALWAPRVRRDEQLVARRTDALIDLLGLGAFADKFVDELSTGTRRAVDIGCIMASQPRLLLLDEPSSGLAQAETEQLGPVLERLARETGCAMLVIEHDIGLVSSVSHRLIAMELGHVVTTGRPDEVVSDRRVLTSYLAATEDVLARSDLAQAVLGATEGVTA